MKHKASGFYLNRLLNIKSLLLLSVFYWPFIPSFAAVSSEDVHNIVDICTNLHRIKKDYVLVGMNIRFEDPAKDLQETVKKVDSEFASLLAGAHLGSALTSRVESAKKKWEAIKAIVTAPPQRELMVDLHKSIKELTDICLKITKEVVDESHIEGEIYVAEAGEMRMETQRVAAMYMMRAWGIELENYTAELRHILEEFEGFYHHMKKADERFITKEAKVLLDEIEKDFLVFEKMAEKDNGRFVPSLARRSAKKLLKKIEKLTQIVVEKVEK